MTDAFLAVDPDSNGKKIDLELIVVNGVTVYRERQVTADPTNPVGLAKVVNTDPASNAYALAVRPIPSAAAQPVSGVFFQATQPVSGVFFQATQPVSGPVTDAQLRASPVPVSGPLTDAQLRASAVPVSGTFFQGTQPISAASLPLPTGASTEATLAAIKAKTDNLDVALSTRTKPADTQPVSGTFWQATQPVSGAFFQATQPVSAAALPLPAGAATEATLALVARDATLGVVGPAPGAYTVLDRLGQVAGRLDTLIKGQLAAAARLATPTAARSTSSTLLHRS